jgi:hypothetical protein
MPYTRRAVLACESTRPEIGRATPTKPHNFHGSVFRLGAKHLCKDVVRQSAGVFTALEAKKQLVHIQNTERPESLCTGNHPLPL